MYVYYAGFGRKDQEIGTYDEAWSKDLIVLVSTFRIRSTKSIDLVQDY